MNVENIIKQLDKHIKQIAWQYYKQYSYAKIEYDDLLQQCYLEILEAYPKAIQKQKDLENINAYIIKSVKNRINNYIKKWLNNPLSTAQNLDIKKFPAFRHIKIGK